MPPTEHQILTSYLLPPAQLPAIISLQEFVSLFPKALQESAASQIRSLYRDLQSQRNTVVDSVSAEIDAEAKRGKALRRHVARQARRQAEDAEEHDDELEIERMLGAVSEAHIPKHTLETIIPGLEDAISELESQLQLLEEEEASLLASVKQTVGDMSDLRYGRLANPKLPDQVLEGLADLQDTCKIKN
ncbi:Cnl2/NKP2 family protein-domain-containing protein [Podospora australis]|uniref:Cnl2/NKP2 family protein-domain-containing protein n=1 Tax=Podospora australis TaxID=1536484 RepID=A0AAN7ALK8_9PEZI|nr:Cnl2/NKP2 family protein-domain-containing protein [Podospora australis]